MQPTTLPEIDAALVLCTQRLRSARIRRDGEAETVFGAQLNRLLEMRLALAHPEIGAS